MKIILEYFKKKENCYPDYSTRHEVIVFGENAADCMKQVEEIRNHHDCAKYTPTEIIRVED